MKKLILLSLLLIPASAKAVVYKYIQTPTSGNASLQAGTTTGFYVSSGTVLNFNASTVTAGAFHYTGADNYLSSATAAITNVPTNGNFGDLLAVTTSGPGTFECDGVVSFNRNSATLTDAYVMGFKTTVGNSAPADPGSTTYVYVATGTALNSIPATGSFSRWRVTVTAPTTIYLKYQANYSAGTPQSRGFMQCEKSPY